jgi:hypothetical protein
MSPNLSVFSPAAAGLIDPVDPVDLCWGREERRGPGEADAAAKDWVITECSETT